MAWWDWLGGAFKGGKEIAEVFTENKENKGQRTHDEHLAHLNLDMAALQQFSSEFHRRNNRTWWDSFIDGLNRLPRPMLTIAVLSFFVLAPINPTRFQEIAKAYELIPPGYWGLLSIIVGFYFGGRMQIKSQDMAMRKDTMHTTKELMALKQELQKKQLEEEPEEVTIYDHAVRSGYKVDNNKVVTEWLKSRS
jgi:hypothetical protein